MSDVTPETWNRIAEVFEQALQVPQSDRARFLSDATAGDPAHVRTEVDRLLAHHDNDPGFMETSAPEAFAEEMSGGARAIEAHPMPERIGGYTIVRLLGEGGMGLVYLAEQVSPHRLVALKVLRPGVVSAEALRRFVSEADILGRLQHPSIAAIFEAGTATIAGAVQPYFVMEYVDGTAITTFAHTQLPDRADRLHVFAMICDAVHYAHQQGVIHRDLKPANVLVKVIERGDTSQSAADRTSPAVIPKVLDFGVARLVDTEPHDLTHRTTHAELIGTLPYMSPEQLTGDARRVDARADIYALGVIGFELLCDSRPHPLQDTTVPEAIRIVSEEEPRPLGSFDRRLRGDLETIFAKALAREPDRRYESAAALAADIRRFLRKEPIHARPATLRYRARTFTRRRPAVAALLVVLPVAIAIGLGATLWQHAQATARAEQVLAVNALLTDILILVDNPDAAHDRHLYGLLLRADERAAEAFDGAPEAEADFRSTIGDAYYRIGRVDDAERQYARCYQLRLPALGPLHADTLSAQSGLASCALAAGRWDEAADMLQEVIDGRTNVLGPFHEKTLGSRHDLAIVMQRVGRRDDARTLFDQVLAAQREHLGQDERDTLVTAMNLAALHIERNDLDRAEALYRDSVDRFLRRYGEDTPDAFKAIGGLARCLARNGKPDEAAPWYDRYVAGFARLLGDDAAGTVVARYNAGRFYWQHGDPDRALNLVRQATAGATQGLGVNNSLTITMHARLGDMLRRANLYEEAAAALLTAYHASCETYGKDAPETQGAIEKLVDLYEDTDDDEEAAKWRALLSRRG